LRRSLLRDLNKQTNFKLQQVRLVEHASDVHDVLGELMPDFRVGLLEPFQEQVLERLGPHRPRYEAEYHEQVTQTEHDPEHQEHLVRVIPYVRVDGLSWNTRLRGRRPVVAWYVCYIPRCVQKLIKSNAMLKYSLNGLLSIILVCVYDANARRLEIELYIIIIMVKYL